MAKKKYDPLWEIVNEKVALQGQERHVDVPCPHCHVTVQLGPGIKVGDRFACGLCGGISEVKDEPTGLALMPVGPA